LAFCRRRSRGIGFRAFGLNRPRLFLCNSGMSRSDQDREQRRKKLPIVQAHEQGSPAAGDAMSAAAAAATISVQNCDERGAKLLATGVTKPSYRASRAARAGSFRI
jgi:hypothetical protein